MHRQAMRVDRFLLSLKTRFQSAVLPGSPQLLAAVLFPSDAVAADAGGVGVDDVLPWNDVEASDVAIVSVCALFACF